MHRSSTRFASTLGLALGASFAIAGVVTVGAVAAGCSSGGGDSASAPTLDEQRAQVEADYSASLQQVNVMYDACLAEGKCVDLSDVGGVTGMSFETHPDGLISAASSLLSKIPGKVCPVLTKIKPVEHLWYFVGGSLNFSSGAVVGATAITGADLVYNLYDEQAAMFYYVGGGGTLGTAVGASAGASAYCGFAVDIQGGQDVIGGWSGKFTTVSAGVSAGPSVGLASLGFGITGSYFWTPGHTLVGVGVSGDVSIGFGAFELPVSGQVSLTAGLWYPWEKANVAFAKSNGTAATSGGSTYTKFSNAATLALSTFSHGGGPGVFAGSAALALAALRKSGMTIEQMCPDGADSGTDGSSGSLINTGN